MTALIDRRAMLAGAVALAASPALPAFYPLPGFLTAEALREMAANSRRKALLRIPMIVEGIDRTDYLAELHFAYADIFERMALCNRPYDELEAEMYAMWERLQRKHDYTPP